MSPIKPLAAAAAGLLLVLLLHAKVGFVVGPSFWHWSYRDIPGGRIYAGMILCSIPFFLAQFLYARQPRTVAICLGLMMLSCFGMKLISVAFRPDVTGDESANLALLQIIVENPDTTSYFSDAASLGVLPLREWIAVYPSVMNRMHLHTGTKPPGPVIYWYFWIQQLGLSDIDHTALIGALCLGALATLSIPATYWFLRTMLRSRRAAFCGASFLSLCPGFVLFFPMMDPLYILLSAPLVGLWFAGLRGDRLRYSILSGGVLGISGLITFNLLVIGLFMAAAVFALRGSLQRNLILAGKHGGAVALSAGITLLLLRATLNYDVIDTFRHAWINQHSVLAKFGASRPYPATAPWDLVDFALGSGWISIVLCSFYLARSAAGFRRRLVWLALGQFVAVAATGLLQLETARVWNFMLPLLMMPIGLELAHWRWSWRWPALATMVLVNAAIAQNVKWIY